MSGRGISKLGLPSIQYRVDLWSPGFESIKKCTWENLSRSIRLCRVAHDFPGEADGKAAIRLASLLASGEVVDSLASSIDMRIYRTKVCGHIWNLMSKVRTKRVRTFTIIPAHWEFPAERLMDVDPVTLINGLRASLYGRGQAGKAKGWLIAFLHSEHDPVADVYRFHVHGAAYGGMVQAIERLRKLPNYRSRHRLPDGSRSPVYRRVRRTWKPLVNIPEPITYLLQSFWPARALFISEDGKRIRVRQKSRIKEPRHSQGLLWLDRYRLEDLTLMIGLRVTKDGLKQTKPVS